MARLGAIALTLIMVFSFLSCQKNKKPKENICLDILGKWIHVAYEFFPTTMRIETPAVNIDDYSRVKKEKLEEAVEFLMMHREEIYKSNLDSSRYELSIEFDYDYNYNYTATYGAYPDGYRHENYKYICYDNEIRLNVRELWFFEYKRT